MQICQYRSTLKQSVLVPRKPLTISLGRCGWMQTCQYRTTLKQSAVVPRKALSSRRGPRLNSCRANLMP